MRLVVVTLVALVACNRPPAKPVTPVAATRSPVFEKSNPRRDLFEGAAFKNGCAGDGDCKIGGCSGEVCTAEEGVNTACIALEDQPKDARCGCLAGECVWYHEAGASPSPDAAAAAPAQGMPCDKGACAAGLKCVTYYGIAGPRGGAFTSCEIPCPLPENKCPAGQKCVTIADGPGRVCRPN